MGENSRFGREPYQVFTVKQDFCNNVYGESPCTAALGTNYVEYSEDYTQAGAWGAVDTVELDDVIDGFQFSKITRGGGGNPSLADEDNLSAPAITDFGTLPTINAAWRVKKDSIPRQKIEITASAIAQTDIGNENFSATAVFTVQDGQFVEFETVTRAQNEDYKIFDKGSYWLFVVSCQPDISQMLGTELQLLVQSGIGIATGGVTAPPVEGDQYFVVSGAQWWVGEGLVDYAKTDADFKIQTGTRKCFNTRSTCQDPGNYDKGVQPLKFVTKGGTPPADDFYIPSLKSVKVTPAKLNPGGADSNAGALGQRASITAVFEDHPYNDRLVDLYRSERDYDPKERGTFWTKWRARNPYYMQRPITLTTGYLKNGELVDKVEREFVITGFSGPDAQGNVSIQGKDVLTLAEDGKAQAPVASTGKLSADITSGATSATLSPAGIGNAEYPASGEIRIGKEVMGFTRSGDDLTITRGQFGTEAKAHDEDDTVQLCLRYVSQAPQDILEDLLANYANVPAQYIDKTQWDDEALDFLPRLYSAIITEPNGVSKLISEMCQQMYFTIWFDERIGKIVLRSVRLAQEDEVFELDDDKHLIEDSIKWRDLADELITQVWVYYGQIDPTEKIDQGSNYSTIAVTADPSAEGADKHNLRRIKTIFSRWIDATNASAAEDLGARILDRYGNAPRQITFRVDAKDDYLWLGDYIRLTNRLRTNSFGVANPVNLQIFEAEESSLGSEYRFVAQEFIPALIGDDQVGDPNVRTIPITSDLLNVNLRTLHDSLFGTPNGTETITFIVREGVTVGGYSAGGGVNVPYAQRVTGNDFYDAGANAEYTGAQMGEVNILQRRGISAVRDTPGSTSVDNVPGTEGRDDWSSAWLVREYPISTALKTGTWPSGIELNLIVESGASVVGEGGNGSIHSPNGTVQEFRAVPGGDGGDALDVEYPVTITNGGIIGGGGGGGKCVGREKSAGAEFLLYIASGGGGAGLEISDVTECKIVATSGFNTNPADRQPANGTIENGGVGGLISNAASNSTTPEVEGYAGGDLGEDGGAGGSLNLALAGRAVAAGAGMITWVNKGDVRGDEVT